MNVRARLGGGFAQARQGALLAVHVGGKFRVRQHERELSGEIRATKRAYRRFYVFRQCGNSVVGKWLAVKLDFFRRRGKAARDVSFLFVAFAGRKSPSVPLCQRGMKGGFFCVLFVRRFYDSGYSARVGFQFFQSDATWLKLVIVGGFDVAVPESVTEP